MAFRASLALLTKHAKPAAAPKNMATTVLEVERKFRALAVPSLTGLAGSPAASEPGPAAGFASVRPLPTRTFHDVYFDTARHALCAAGAWVRRRDGVWQAKVRRGGWRGDFVNSRFEELVGAPDVAACVRELLRAEAVGVQAGGGEVKEEEEGTRDAEGSAEDENFGLRKMAEFVTTREGWLVDGEFRVVRDRTDFGHEVGEVELQVEVDARMGEAEKGALMDEMDRRIGEFMRRYAWAWVEGKPVGKLTAYFDMVERSRGKKKGEGEAN